MKKKLSFEMRKKGRKRGEERKDVNRYLPGIMDLALVIMASHEDKWPHRGLDFVYLIIPRESARCGESENICQKFDRQSNLFLCAHPQNTETTHIFSCFFPEFPFVFTAPSFLQKKQLSSRI